MAFELPFNLNAEQTVLGAMMVDEAALSHCIYDLSADDFYANGKAHKLIYEAILSLFSNHSPVDVQTVTNELLVRGQLKDVGDLEYLVKLVDQVVSTVNIEFYTSILKDHKVLRNLLIAINGIRDDYSKGKVEDINEFIRIADKTISDVTKTRRISNFQFIEETVKNVEAAFNVQKTGQLTGIDTGLAKINEITHGLQKGNMIIIAARPSVGKTALALQIAKNAASKTNKPIVIFSLEMPSGDLVKRLVANDSGVSLDELIQGGQFLEPKLKALVTNSFRNIAELNIYIDDSAGIKVQDIMAKTRLLQGKLGDLGLIIIDYVGLISTDDNKRKNASRQELVSEISRQIQQLARETETPVILVSQLSRKVEGREGNRPQMSDLRESGSLEQDADQVFLLYNYKYQKEDLGPSFGDRKSGGKQKEKEAAIDKLVGEFATSQQKIELIELIIAKNRNGQTGTVYLFFNKKTGNFSTPSKSFMDRYFETLKKYSVGGVED